MNRYRGFTLFELVVVIIIIGILAATVFPRLNIDSFRGTGGFQQGFAMIRFGQKLAITTGCQVDVHFDMTDCELMFNTCGGGVNIPNPSTNDTNFCANSEPGVGPDVDFNFNNIGAPNAGQIINFGGGRTVTVEANTGFAYET